MENNPAPRVFISYSHDSPEHKSWVEALGTALRQNGVDIVLDRWELHLGDDLPKFMERSVREADRVLVVCTETYVHKADEGIGGVGYEAMIVTGQLIRDLGTAKFVPVIRQSGDTRVVPAPLSTRLYIDFSDDSDFDPRLQDLLREIHSAPVHQKPPLGRNPFSASTQERKSNSTSDGNKIDRAEVPFDPIDPASTYDAALNAVRSGDVDLWRSVVRGARSGLMAPLREWHQLHAGNVPSSAEDLQDQTLQGLAVFAPVFAVALAGVASGRHGFGSQVGLLEDLLDPRGWDQSGYTVRVSLPRTAGYIYQALYGAACLHSYQLTMAIQLARTRVHLPGYSEPAMLWRIPELVGWPEALGGNSRASWQVLTVLADKWPWLATVFGDPEEYRQALTSYYMALNFNDYATTLAEGNGPNLTPGQTRVEVPTHFGAQEPRQLRAAYRMFVNDADQVRAIWRDLGVADDTVRQYWQDWLGVCQFWHRQEYRFSSAVFYAYREVVTDLVGSA